MLRWFVDLISRLRNGAIELHLPQSSAPLDVQPRPANVNMPGDFSVTPECCLLCGVPWHYAPDLFGYDDAGCWVKKQPATEDEMRRMIFVVRTQELDCIRYSGRDPKIIADISAPHRAAE